MSAVKRDPLGELALLPPVHRDRIVRELPLAMRVEARDRWARWALEGQHLADEDWTVWLIRAGRGFGKTRAGAEWVSDFARRHPKARIALVSGTIEDVRRVMIEGEAGLIAVACDDEAIKWRRDAGELEFASGAVAYVYSAATPEALRGPAHDIAWCDELGKWRGEAGEAAWDNLMLGLRIGERPRVMVTTTPRSTRLMQKVMKAEGLRETNGKTKDNPYLPATFLAAMQAEYGGTRLGRQELDGELLDDVERALWTRGGLEGCRVREHPKLTRVVVGVDPPASDTGDACGIVAVGRAVDGTAYVIEDASVTRASPKTWAAAVAGCAQRVGAHRVIAESNNGGKMVETVLLSADSRMPVTLVHASERKAARAEPVAVLYERGRVRHVGAMPALEDEMCGLGAGGEYAGPGRSPDRADALVWAMTELMLGPRGAEAGVRVL